MQSEPALPKVEARGNVRRHPGTEATLVYIWRRLIGAKAGSSDGEAGRMGRRQDSLTLGPAAMEMVWSMEEERHRVKLRVLTATPARLPLRLAR
ncbi:hypothetical protein AAFF_G00409610 [Aldrovandia affinis]|uniref:Uncharacterized protein n=1 Tax=Aldrovandia affinis TaxID=143900 RepID=A0AAD7SBL1_9TELE|nr:hypothetical protein AAFF_G00409610 [Aldrovandia affinis]